MKILIACEFSGIVRDAFAARGHDAWSCDLLPTERPGQHIQGDVLDVLEDPPNGGKWDMMIAHPPCTHLSVSGARWFKGKQVEQHEAVLFFLNLMGQGCIGHGIKRVCVENPIGIMSRVFRKPDQIVHPWMFGHEESKATCLWLTGLPLLKPTKIVSESYSCACGVNFPLALGKHGCPNCLGESRVVIGHGHKVITKGGNVLPKWYNLPPSETRWAQRSVTFQGVANAMADQWGR